MENAYETRDAEYNANRRAVSGKTRTRQLPGVSPLVFSRFLLEYTAFLSLSDMGKDLPSYEEIPVALDMPEDVGECYQAVQNVLQKVLKNDRKAAQKILSAYLNLLTVYPDQPYDQPEVIHPITGMPIVTPKSCGDFSRLFPKEEKVLELVRQKTANGERVLIYTSWTRTDSQQKLLKLLQENGYRTEILAPQIATEKREEWVDKRVKTACRSSSQILAAWRPVSTSMPSPPSSSTRWAITSLHCGRRRADRGVSIRRSQRWRCICSIMRTPCRLRR